LLQLGVLLFKGSEMGLYGHIESPFANAMSGVTILFKHEKCKLSVNIAGYETGGIVGRKGISGTERKA